jgi:phosphopentomutase
MGVVLDRALPTYPGGFPPELIERLRRAIGRDLICNRPDNGLSAIEDFGAEQLASGALIVYTSQDSVLQLAGHVERIPPAELYLACERARAVMSGADAVGRVIARPFEGAPGSFRRTAGRRDFALSPPGWSYLQALERAGAAVHGVGKIPDLFAGVGIGSSHPGSDNGQALASTRSLLGELEEGLVFVNLIETDQVFGHRKDTDGFVRALEQIDAELATMLAGLRRGDLLVVTADHGVDPAHPGTDHTREYAPLLACTGAMLEAGLAGARHDGPLADVGASVLAWLTGAAEPRLPGRAFVS